MAGCKKIVLSASIVDHFGAGRAVNPVLCTSFAVSEKIGLTSRISAFPFEIWATGSKVREKALSKFEPGARREVAVEISSRGGALSQSLVGSVIRAGNFARPSFSVNWNAILPYFPCRRSDLKVLGLNASTGNPSPSSWREASVSPSKYTFPSAKAGSQSMAAWIVKRAESDLCHLPST